MVHSGRIIQGNLIPFWGERVYRLGVGPCPIPFGKLKTENLTQAIAHALNDQDMRRKAAELGEKLQKEDEVGRAVNFIQAFLGSPN